MMFQEQIGPDILKFRWKINADHQTFAAHEIEQVGEATVLQRFWERVWPW